MNCQKFKVSLEKKRYMRYNQNKSMKTMKKTRFEKQVKVFNEYFTVRSRAGAAIPKFLFFRVKEYNSYVLCLYRITVSLSPYEYW